MRDPGRDDLDLRTASGQEIEEVMKRGAADALLAHKRAGIPVVVWDRAKDEVVIVPAEGIAVPEEGEAEGEKIGVEFVFGKGLA